MRLILAFLGVALLATACSPGGSSGERQVRDVIARQEQLMSARNWPDLYQTYSPAFRSQCSYDAFLAVTQGWDSSGIDPGKLKHDGVRVRVSGDKAYVTYTLTYDGETVQEVTDADPDVYARVDGRWYDEVDSNTSCD